MKLVIICLLLCSSAFGQTVHIEDEDIVYQGKITAVLTSSDLEAKLQSVLNSGSKQKAQIQANDTSVTATGKIKLETPHSIIRILNYTIKLVPEKKGYSYLIDNISLTEQTRGEKPETKVAKELLDGLGEAGKTYIKTEKLLNEIDMRLQEIIARLKQ